MPINLVLCCTMPGLSNMAKIQGFVLIAYEAKLLNSWSKLWLYNRYMQ